MEARNHSREGLFNPLHYHGVVLLNDWPAGSAVYWENGLFITAKHVLQGSYWDKLSVLYRNEKYDGEPIFLENDLALIKTFASPEVRTKLNTSKLFLRDEVETVQLVILNGEITNFWISARISLIDERKEKFFLDKPLFPGASGSGVWKNGKLAGIITSLIIRKMTSKTFAVMFASVEILKKNKIKVL